MNALQQLLNFPHLSVPPRHVEWVATANAGNYTEKKSTFYPFKSRFMRAHALCDGIDLQTITLKCWCGDGVWRGSDDYYSLPKERWEPCNRCGGTGIYARRKVVLVRWLLCGRIFHEPRSLGWHPLDDKIIKERFDGLIKHTDPGERISRRCMDRLLLRYEPRTLINLWQRRWSDRFYWRKQSLLRQWHHVREAFRRADQSDEIPF